MDIELNGKIYKYNVNGTVGNTFMVEQMTGEPFDALDKTHSIYLLFAILKNSNTDVDITLDWFLSVLTAKSLSDLNKYTVKRFNELEGINTASDDEPSNEKKN